MTCWKSLPPPPSPTVNSRFQKIFRSHLPIWNRALDHGVQCYRGENMNFRRGAGRHPAAEMNVTPLIDVLLVLLIIFMIITPMDPHGVYADIPQEHGKPTSDEAAIVLELTQGRDAAPALSINRQQLTWVDLKARLLDIYKTRANGVLFIRGDTNVDFEYVAEAIDAAHAVHVQRVGLLR